MLYVLSYPNPEELAVHITWMTLGVIITLMVIVPADRVAASVSGFSYIFYHLGKP
jgi:hypothetical protein